ncbi:hypothetical protein VTH82DRAFT_2213 [Thermothelomyces myriococcoides]
MALFIVATALLRAGDHVVLTRPNYATNLETPRRAIGCDVTHVDLDFDSGFRLDVARVAAAVRPGATRLISVCSPNNPTGTRCSAAQLRALARLAAGSGCYLLVDETYADLVLDYEEGEGEEKEEEEKDGPVAAATLGPHVVGVSSMSKAYGVPGIRIGWLTTTSAELRERFLAAKEQISISGSVLDELVAERVLSRRAELLAATVADVRRRRDRVARWVEHDAADLVEWVRPAAGVMCFVRMKHEPPGGTAAFYRRLLDDHGAYVGPGRWFECDDRMFRLGYGWPTWEELEKGLDAITKALRG